MPINNKYTKSIIFGLIAFVILVVSVMAVRYVQNISNRAANQLGTSSLDLFPTTTQFVVGKMQSIDLNANIPATNIDGIQVVVKVADTIPDDLVFNPKEIPGLSLVYNTLIRNTGGTEAELKLVYVLTDPTIPFNQSIVNIGQFLFTPKTDGTMTITFDNTLSKIAQNTTSQDVLMYPQTERYSFRSPNTPSPIPTATPKTEITNPPATATPTPEQSSTPIACSICNNIGGDINSCFRSSCKTIGSFATCGTKTYCCGTDGYWGSQYDACNVVKTPSPVPTAMATSTPVSTPSYTTVPSPSPIANKLPIITTRYINPFVLLNRRYVATIKAYDPDKDILSARITGLPTGLKYSCSIPSSTIACTISGTATTRGTYDIRIVVKDSKGGQTTRKYRLFVVKSLL